MKLKWQNTDSLTHLELLIITGAISIAVTGSPISKGLQTASQLSLGGSVSPHIITYRHNGTNKFRKIVSRLSFNQKPLVRRNFQLVVSPLIALFCCIHHCSFCKLSADLNKLKHYKQWCKCKAWYRWLHSLNFIRDVNHNSPFTKYQRFTPWLHTSLHFHNFKNMMKEDLPLRVLTNYRSN